MQPNRRKKKFVKPRMQSRGILIGLLVALTVLVVQAITMTYSLNRISDDLPREGATLLDRLPGMMLQNLAITSVVLIPILVMIGVKVTHRLAGPLYRIESYLRTILNGEDPGELRSRRTDELQDLSALVNQLRQRLHGNASNNAAAAIDVDDVASLVREQAPVESETEPG